MTTTRKNVIANYFGSGWSAGLSFVSIPFLLSMLGAESYGLVSFFFAIKAIATVFDFGLAVATNREVAFRLGRKDPSVPSLVKTVEVLNWIIGIIISLIVWSLLRVFIVDWVSAEGLTSDQLVMMSLLFAVSLGVSWPVVLYQNLLRSFGEHAAYNAALCLSSTLRNPGALFVLWVFSPKIEVFMSWSLIVSVIEIMTYWTLVKGKIPLVSDSLVSFFNYKSLRGMKRFALGTGFSSIIASIIFQADKVLISKLLNLELLGYYSAILAIVGSFGKLTTPIVRAVFPHLALTYGSGHIDSVADIYKNHAHIVNGLLMPIVLALVTFGPQILELWLPPSVATDDLGDVLVLLAVAYMFYSLANMPIIILMVFKDVNILVISRIIALAFLIPLLQLLITNYGLEGAALAVFSCSVFLYVVLVVSVSRRIFPTYRMNELTMVVGPLLVSAPIFYLSKTVLTIWPDGNLVWISLAGVGVIASYLIIFRSYLLKLDVLNRGV